MAPVLLQREQRHAGVGHVALFDHLAGHHAVAGRGDVQVAQVHLDLGQPGFGHLQAGGGAVAAGQHVVELLLGHGLLGVEFLEAFGHLLGVGQHGLGFGDARFGLGLLGPQVGVVDADQQIALG